MTRAREPAMTDAPRPILETRGLTMRFGGVVAVDNVNFSMAEGELRCLIGPNGAGKTTFFRCLTHQYKPTSGQVIYRGADITGSHTFQIARRGIGIKTQVPSVFDGLDVRENIWLSARRHHGLRESNRRVDEILERIGLTGVANRLVGQLAHGERQGVELAIVLTGDPDLILLDEPTAGMTHEEVHRTTEMIREINRTASLIVVEHDMQFIKAIANKVTVFNQGAILVEDTMENVLKNQDVRDVYLGKREVA
jgi:branched-chain amino acid transport system ATP-binding protein